MAANGDELVTLKQMKDNQAFKKIESEYNTLIYPDVLDMSNTFISLNDRNTQNNVTMVTNGSTYICRIDSDPVNFMINSDCLRTESYGSTIAHTACLLGPTTGQTDAEQCTLACFGSGYSINSDIPKMYSVGEFEILGKCYKEGGTYKSEIALELEDTVNTNGNTVNILKYLLPFNSHDLEDPTSKQMLVNQNGEYEWQKMVASDEDFKAYLGIS